MYQIFLKLLSVVICFILIVGCSNKATTSESDFGTNSSAVINSYTEEGGSGNASPEESISNGGTNSEKTSNSKDTSSNEVVVDGITDSNVQKYSGTRDPFYWPFSEKSIWNMPIGSNAKLKAANFDGMGKDGHGNKFASYISIDEEYIFKVPAGSPIVDVFSPSSWNKRWPGNEILGKMQIPSDFYLADATKNSTPNNCTAFLMPDGRTIKQLEPACRLGTGNTHIVGWLYDDVDIYGEGIGGTHYGSGLSAIGGSIRKGELISDEPIKHAIKLNVHAKKYLYYDANSGEGFVWPADRNDSYAASGDMAYGGVDPELRMGTLLTIPQNITAQSIGIRTAVGEKLFYALQNYGCYIVDDSAWNAYAWSAEAGVVEEVKAKYGIDLNTGNSKDAYYKDAIALIENLYIVTNNGPSSIGGGGTPCKPLAPDFKE